MSASPSVPSGTLPLSGLRVVDLTAILFGPMATAMLADLGADVIKVEAPGGDIMRYAKPMRSPAMGTVYMNSNRGKRSIVLDLKQSGAHDVLHRLVAGADVFIHSMRRSAAERLGIAPEAIHAIKPDLIYCTACGFGGDGPYKDLPAYDDAIQAASGLASLAGGAGEPQYVRSVAADKIASLYLSNALMTALLMRERTGEGQVVEVPMFESLATFVLTEHLCGASFVPFEGDVGYSRVLAANRRPYRTKDSHVCILPYTTDQWKRFLILVGRPEVAGAAWLADASARSARVNELYALIDEVAPTRTTAEWVAAMREIDIPSMPVNNLDDLLEDPHLKASGLFETYDHPSEGKMRGVTRPVKFSKIGRQPGTAPRLGQDTLGVLNEIGFDAAEIDNLLESGAAVGAD